ncbi:MAG: ATP synthase F1 subunit delta [Chloroflexi bacterium]|nr:ATP synthase F1 subunit delta [Chloroflexota bacterium]
MAGDAPNRYAQAVFAIAVEAGSIAAWRSDLADIAQVLTSSQAAPVLADSRIPLDRRLAMVDRTLDVQPLARNLAKLLVQRGRSLAAADVARSFNGMADAHEGIAHARVTAAVDLNAGQLAAIEQRLSQSLGKQVRATASVDPALIGGVVVRVGDKLVDGSVRTRLRLLRRELQGAR